MSNVLKTGLLLGVLTALLVLAGQAIAGERGMIIAFVFAAIMNFVSYWFSDKLVLAMYGAQPVDEAQAPGSTPSCGGWPRARRSRCRGSTSSPATRPTPSRPAGTRSTPRWR